MKEDRVSYDEFMLDLADKSKKLLDKYHKLSPKDQMRANAVGQRILKAHGIAGIIKFISNPLGF